MNADRKISKGIPLDPEEAGKLDPAKIEEMLTESPSEPEVEGQTFRVCIQCPFCGTEDRVSTDGIAPKLVRCSSCGALFKSC